MRPVAILRVPFDRLKITQSGPPDCRRVNLDLKWAKQLKITHKSLKRKCVKNQSETNQELHTWA